MSLFNESILWGAVLQSENPAPPLLLSIFWSKHSEKNWSISNLKYIEKYKYSWTWEASSVYVLFKNLKQIQVLEQVQTRI